MPQGKHKGVRVVLTVNQDSYAEWKRMAEASAIPVATLMRETLEMTLPSVSAVLEAVQQHKQEPEVIDEIMGRLLWDAIKKGVM